LVLLEISSDTRGFFLEQDSGSFFYSTIGVFADFLKKGNLAYFLSFLFSIFMYNIHITIIAIYKYTFFFKKRIR